MGIVAAYVVPHPPLAVPKVGLGQERAIQATLDAYREVARRVAAHAPDTVVVVSPHAPAFRDCFCLSTGEAARGDMGRFGARGAQTVVRYDEELVAAIAACARKHGAPVCGSGMGDAELDHGTLVPLLFLRETCDGFRVVRAGLSGLSPASHRALGRCIAEAASDAGRRCVLVASGDLSHKLAADGPYGFAPEGPVFDRDVTALLSAGDLEGLFDIDGAFADAAAECGLRSFQVMAGALEGVPFSHELLSYEGPFGVGYAVAAFEVEGREGGAAGATEAEAVFGAVGEGAADAYVALARASVEGFVRTGRPIDRPVSLPPELLDERAGAFVSLHAHGALRGCIGTVEPVTGCVADEVLRNAVAAASEDPRFSPVRADELDDLEYSVDVLRPPMRVGSAAELDPARWGVIVSKGRRRGLLLPNLEGVDTVEEQLAIAKRKAGIDPADDDVMLERFEVVRHTRGGEARRG